MVFVLSHGVRDGFILTDTKQPDGEYERFHKSEIWNRISSIGFLKHAFKLYLMGVSIYSIELLSGIFQKSAKNLKYCTKPLQK
jgi:hypothetical protein